MHVLEGGRERSLGVRGALLAFILREGKAHGVERFSVDRVDADDGAWVGCLRELGFERELAFHVMTRQERAPAARKAVHTIP